MLSLRGCDYSGYPVVHLLFGFYDIAGFVFAQVSASDDLLTHRIIPILVYLHLFYLSFWSFHSSPVASIPAYHIFQGTRFLYSDKQLICVRRGACRKITAGLDIGDRSFGFSEIGKTKAIMEVMRNEM